MPNNNTHIQASLERKPIWAFMEMQSGMSRERGKAGTGTLLPFLRLLRDTHTYIIM